jgi:hypothetical protein
MLIFGSAATITLIADGPVHVHARAVVDLSHTQVVAMLRKGEEVAFVSCEDLKHSIVPEVLLRDGTKGYVLVSNFNLRR